MAEHRPRSRALIEADIQTAEMDVEIAEEDLAHAREYLAALQHELDKLAAEEQTAGERPR